MIALEYYEREDVAASSSLIGSGAHWLFDVLQGGLVYFPADGAVIYWGKEEGPSYRSEHKPTWGRYAHCAAEIFRNHGWRHPILCRALNGDLSAIKQWPRLEAPVVIKGRFNTIKHQGRNSEAITLARMMGGDNEALHYLVSNGLANDAIVQASCSGNEKGLAQLGSDLISIDPRASFMCMQAHILSAVGKAGRGRHEYPRDSVNSIVDLFVKRVLVPRSNKDANEAIELDSALVPSLRRLSIMATTRAFLFSAKSTDKLQSFLETYRGDEPDSVLAFAAFAVVSGAISPDALEHSLGRAGLLSVAFIRGPASIKYSGLLTHFDHSPESPIISEHIVDISSAVFECANIFLERLNVVPVRSFEEAIFSASYVAAHTGCQTYALQVLQSLRDGNITFEEYSPFSPFNALTACFSCFFCCEWAQGAYPELPDLFLDTFLRLRSSETMKINEDARRAQIWVAIAYGQAHGMLQAGSTLAEHVFFNQDHSVRSCEDPDQEPIKCLKELSIVDTREGDGLRYDHTMTPFASSSKRTIVAAPELEHLCSGYIHRLFRISSSMGKPLNPGAVAECVQIHAFVSPSFWRLEAHQVESRLSNLTGLALGLSETSFLHYTYRVMLYVDYSVRCRQESWSTQYFVLVCGLNWLRSALLADRELPSFDHTREELHEEEYGRVVENWAMQFDRYDWEYGDRSSYKRDCYMDREYVRTALGLTVALKSHALAVQEMSPHLSHNCLEALALCEIMSFWLHPTPINFKAIVNLIASTERREEELPSHLQPEHLLNSVLDSSWGTASTFVYKEAPYECDNVKPTAPLLASRVCLALHHGKVKAAAALCIVSGESNLLWSSLSSKSDYSGIDRATRRSARELLQGCLLVLQGAAANRDGFSDEFINIAMHIILTMNWFRSCAKCLSHSRKIEKHANGLVPSTANMAALHESASAWDEADDVGGRGEASATLRSCTDMLRCLSRCCTRLDDADVFKKCKDCSPTSDDYGVDYEFVAEKCST